MRLVLLTAEPGDPLEEEQYRGNGIEILAAANRAYYDMIQQCRDLHGRSFLFHRHLRDVLDIAWPGMSLERQLRRTWVTDTYLCSAEREGEPVSHTAEICCGRNYLSRQLELIPDALVVAFGGKAQARAGQLGITVHKATALAPPGCNMPGAKESWKGIRDLLHDRRLLEQTPEGLANPYQPMDTPRAIPSPNRIFSDDEMERMRFGHRATDEGDHWEVFFDGDRIHTVRSRTGYEMHQADFVRGDSGWRIVTALAEFNQERVKGLSAKQQTAKLDGVIQSRLLSRWSAG